jgi:hypothetical protein
MGECGEPDDKGECIARRRRRQHHAARPSASCLLFSVAVLYCRVVPVVYEDKR